MADEGLDFLYRGRKSYTSHVLERFAAVSVFLGLIGGLIAASVTEQFCPTPFSVYNNDTAQIDADAAAKQQCWWQGAMGIGMFVVFVLGYSLMRRFVFPALLFILNISVLCLIFVLIFPLDSFFEYIKLFSVLGGVTFILMYRTDNMFRHQEYEKIGYFAEVYDDDAFTKFGRFFASKMKVAWLNQWGWSWILWSALVINIVEAVATEMAEGYYWNGLAGIWLVFAMPRAENWWFPKLDRRVFFFTFMRRRWQKVLYVDNTPTPAGLYDMVYETDWFWVFMYTTWNACFSYAERTEHFLIIVVVLTAALYGEANFRDLGRFFEIDPHLYIQCRSFTLAIRYIILAFFDVYETTVDVRHWFNHDVAFYWGVGNAVACAAYMTYKLFTFDGEDSRSSVVLEHKGENEAAVAVADGKA